MLQELAHVWLEVREGGDLSPEGLVDLALSISLDHCILADTVRVVWVSDHIGNNLHKLVLGDGIICPCHICLNKVHPGCWVQSAHTQYEGPPGPVDIIQAQYRCPQKVSMFCQFIVEHAEQSLETLGEMLSLLPFVKGSGAHITHVHNGPKTTGLGDETQSADGHGWPGLLALPDFFLRQFL